MNYDNLLTLERWTPKDSGPHRLCVLPDGTLHVFMHQSGKGKNSVFVSCLFTDRHLVHFSH